MRPTQKDSYLNETSHHDQNQNPRFFKGGSYRHYDLEAWNQASSRTRDGTHAGKGPKFYKRSDELIREDVCEELMQNPDLDATHIDVKVENATVTLSGSVPNRQMKRLAETCIDSVHGIHDVFNHLQASANSSL